jgi:hypothetical protein
MYTYVCPRKADEEDTPKKAQSKKETGGVGVGSVGPPPLDGSSIDGWAMDSICGGRIRCLHRRITFSAWTRCGIFPMRPASQYDTVWMT